jgi:hypothetical protein
MSIIFLIFIMRTDKEADRCAYRDDGVNSMRCCRLDKKIRKGGSSMVKKGLALLLSVVFLLATGGAVIAAEFQSDMKIEGAGEEVTGKVFVKGEKMRQEMSTPMGTSVTITDQDAGVMYVLMPEQKMYMEMPLDPDMMMLQTSSLEESLEGRAEIKKAGTETVAGYKCDIYEIKYNDPGMGESRAWVSQKLQYPVKVISKTSEGTVTLTYFNIVEGKIDPEIFKVPGGYQKLSGY